MRSDLSPHGRTMLTIHARPQPPVSCGSRSCQRMETAVEPALRRALRLAGYALLSAVVAIVSCWLILWIL